MTRVAWNDAGQRFYEAGADRGVLYLSGQPGVPWNGLLGVNENTSGGEAKPYYLDGYKYLNIAVAEDFGATISAFASPREFDACDGSAEIHHGLIATQQPRKPFGFSYRTLVGNDVDGLSLGYKIHIVYNALASPAQRSYQSLSNAPTPIKLDWGITTVPPQLAGIRPTAHFVIDSRITPPRLLQTIEDILYGSINGDPRLPTADELAALFRSLPPIAATNWMTNGSFELPTAAVTIRRNFVQYPTTATLGWTSTGSPSAFSSENGRLKLTAGSTNANRLGVTGPMASAKAAGDYVVSFKGQAPDPTVTHARAILYDSATSTVRASVTIPVVAGGVSDYKYEFNMNATGAFNIVYFEFVSSTSVASGAIVYISEPLIESGTIHRLYFGPNQLPKERRNAFGQPQARSGTGWFSNDGTVYPRTWDAAGGQRPGTGAVLFTRTTNSLNSVLASAYGVGMASWTGTTDWVPVTPGEVWTISSHAKSDKPFNTRMIARFRTAAGVDIGGSLTGEPTNDTAANTWARGSITITVPDGAYFMSALQNVNLASGNVTGGEKTWMTDALAEKVSSLDSFFDATVTPPSGFGVASEGTLGLSPSYMYDADFSLTYTGAVGTTEIDLTGVGVGVYSSPSSVVRAIQSTRWVKAGTKSLRQIPVHTARGSAYTELANHVSPRGLIPGRTYTLIINFYQDAPQGFGATGNAYRSVGLIGATLTEYNVYAQAQDVAGEQEVRLVFTVPPTGNWYIRLYNGGMLGEASVWWDNAAIIDGVYSGPAFNGDTPDTDIRIYDWVGLANQSESTLRTWY